MEEDIHAVRNGRITTQTVVERGTTSSSVFVPEEMDSFGADPLAQTFKVSGLELVGDGGSDDRKARDIGPTGKFLTSLDLYFSEKDDTFPMRVEIRTVVNGYPGPRIVPFSTVTKFPADIQTSSDASAATKFTFPSPVYL